MRLFVLLFFLFFTSKAIAQSTYSGMAKVSDTRLYYEIAGKGEPMIFIHGWGLDTRAWDLQWSYFAKHFKVIRYDIRGFGQSDRARDPHNPTEDLKILLDYLKIDKVHLVGTSIGGNIALNFAAKYPNHTNKVVVADTYLDGSDEENGTYQKTLKKIIDLASQQGWHDEEQRKWLLSPLMRPYAADDQTLINLSEITADYNGDHFINPRINPDFGKPTTIELLPMVKSPFLVIVGENDDESIIRTANMLEKIVPNTQKTIISNAGHLSNMDKPKVFNRIIRRFLKQ